MLLNVQHTTCYTYTESLNYTIQQLRLTPRSGFGQNVRQWDIRVNGHLHPFEDAYGNLAHTLVIDAPHREIRIVAKGEVETDIDQPPAENDLPLDVYRRFTPLTMPDQALESFSGKFADPSMTDHKLEDLMFEIIQHAPYARGHTTASTTAAKAFGLGVGVCQDHAHIFIACCRGLGIPARYISGYLFTEDGSLIESHAWADAWLPEGGWHSFDISNGTRAGGVHVRLAAGLDYHDACPISGVRIGGGLETMVVSVQVSQMQQMQQQ